MGRRRRWMSRRAGGRRSRGDRSSSSPWRRPGGSWFGHGWRIEQRGDQPADVRCRWDRRRRRASRPTIRHRLPDSGRATREHDDRAPRARRPAPPTRQRGRPRRSVAPTTTAGSYASLPDGSPEPVVVVLDDERVGGHRCGAESAGPRRVCLALVATSNQYPAAPFDDQLAIDSNVPVGVGVRLPRPQLGVVPGGARRRSCPTTPVSSVASSHLMNTHPNVTAVIVGHADQRG